MNFVPRTEWGGPEIAPGHVMSGAKLLVILHHSHAPHRECGTTKAVERKDMLSMHRYHIQREWGGFSYGWAVFQSGNIYEGRGWGRTGAHTKGRNSSSVGIVLVIDGEHNEPTPAAVEAVKAIISEGVRLGHISPMHEVAPHDRFQQKVCPGKLVKSSGLLGGAVPSTGDAILTAMPTLRLGSGGKNAPTDIFNAVKRLQVLLKMDRLYHSGYFGDKTFRAVTEYQKQHGMKVDGIVGPKTWTKILER